jgi:hypothetical protein
MQGALAFCKWLEATPVGASVRQSLWLFPAIETVHLLGMAALLATIGTFDLRLAGILLRRDTISSVGRRLLPWAWAAFAIQVITGGLLFSSEASHMVVNPAFRVKMLLIVLAGTHALAFQWATRKRIPAWDGEAAPPALARIAGVLSLLLWMGVVAAGRWIGFI